MQLDRKNKLFIHGKWLEHTKTEHDDESENLQQGPENARLKCVHKPAILQWVGGWVCMSEGYNTTGS